MEIYSSFGKVVLNDVQTNDHSDGYVFAAHADTIMNNNNKIKNISE